MARSAETYRGARRNAARRQKLIWREGRRITWIGGFRYGWHASMPQPGGTGQSAVPKKPEREAA